MSKTMMNINSQNIEVNTRKRLVSINGDTVPFKRFMTGKSITIADDGVTIDGYRLINGEWVK